MSAKSSTEFVYFEHRLPMASHSQELPPRSTVHDYLSRWEWDGTIDRIHHELYVRCREQAGREADSNRRDYRRPKTSKAPKKGGPY